MWFMIPYGNKKWILLRELYQDLLEFFVVYDTEMTLVNIVNDVERDGIRLCVFFYEQVFFAGQV